MIFQSYLKSSLIETIVPRHQLGFNSLGLEPNRWNKHIVIIIDVIIVILAIFKIIINIVIVSFETIIARAQLGLQGVS